MFAKRSELMEIMDDLALNTADLEKNLHELILLNTWFGSKKTLLSALNHVLSPVPKQSQQKTLTIVDLGCGSGDLVHAMSQWFKHKKLSINLIGIDANPLMIKKAQQLYSQNNVDFKNINIFSADFTRLTFDIVTLNTFCHHFDNDSLIKLLKQLFTQTRVAIIINDLHRHPISYFFIKYLTHWFKLSATAQHDAPLSVLRAFRKKELLEILKLANINSFKLNWCWPFRWQLTIWIC